MVLVALAGAAAFLVAAVLGAALVAAFLGAAAFLAGASFAAVFLALAAVFGAALVALVSVFLLSAFFAAGGEPAFALASLTGPEEPVSCQNCIKPVKVSSSTSAGWKDEKELLTLGALEDTRLATLGKSTVELVGEGGLGHAGEVVVGLNVLLESLTAVGIVSNEHINVTLTECKATDLLP